MTYGIFILVLWCIAGRKFYFWLHNPRQSNHPSVTRPEATSLFPSPCESAHERKITSSLSAASASAFNFSKAAGHRVHFVCQKSMIYEIIIDEMTIVWKRMQLPNFWSSVLPWLWFHGALQAMKGPWSYPHLGWKLASQAAGPRS